MQAAETLKRYPQCPAAFISPLDYNGLRRLLHCLIASAVWLAAVPRLRLSFTAFLAADPKGHTSMIAARAITILEALFRADVGALARWRWRCRRCAREAEGHVLIIAAVPNLQIGPTQRIVVHHIDALGCLCVFHLDPHSVLGLVENPLLVGIARVAVVDRNRGPIRSTTSFYAPAILRPMKSAISRIGIKVFVVVEIAAWAIPNHHWLWWRRRPKTRDVENKAWIGGPVYGHPSLGTCDQRQEYVETHHVQEDARRV